MKFRYGIRVIPAPDNPEKFLVINKWDIAVFESSEEEEANQTAKHCEMTIENPPGLAVAVGISDEELNAVMWRWIRNETREAGRA